MAKRVFKYILLFSALIVLQISLVPLLAIYAVHPDLVLIGTIFVAIRHGAVAAIITGFVAGLAQDATSANLYGLHALAKSIAGFTAGSILKSKQSMDLRSISLITLGTTLIHNLVRDGVYLIQAGYGIFHLLIRYVIPNSLYTIAIAMIAYIAFSESFVRKAPD